jgi:hypothetical protein
MQQIWSFVVPADGTGAAANPEQGLRYVPDLWAPSGKTLLVYKGLYEASDEIQWWLALLKMELFEFHVQTYI